MKFYFSSYHIGSDPNKLLNLIKQNKPNNHKTKVGIVINAKDDEAKIYDRSSKNQEKIKLFENLGLSAEILDLQKYFGQEGKLLEYISSLDMIRICGGNTFVLRQAMYLSGLDNIIHDLIKTQSNLIYGGDSAGVCILYKSLKGLDILDNPDIYVYPEISETIWSGIGILQYMVIPHYQTTYDLNFAKLVDQTVDYCVQNNIPCYPLRDGEVIIEDI